MDRCADDGIAFLLGEAHRLNLAELETFFGRPIQISGRDVLRRGSP
jgi:hypothetical protein